MVLWLREGAKAKSSVPSTPTSASLHTRYNNTHQHINTQKVSTALILCPFGRCACTSKGILSCASVTPALAVMGAPACRRLSMALSTANNRGLSTFDESGLCPNRGKASTSPPHRLRMTHKASTGQGLGGRRREGGWGKGYGCGVYRCAALSP